MVFGSLSQPRQFMALSKCWDLLFYLCLFVFLPQKTEHILLKPCEMRKRELFPNVSSCGTALLYGTNERLGDTAKNMGELVKANLDDARAFTRNTVAVSIDSIRDPQREKNYVSVFRAVLAEIPFCPGRFWSKQRRAFSAGVSVHWCEQLQIRQECHSARLEQ